MSLLGKIIIYGATGASVLALGAILALDFVL